MKKLILIILAAALLTVFSGCSFLMGPDSPQGSGDGNLSISFGIAGNSGSGRGVTSGAELPEAVLAGLRYGVSLTGPGGEVLSKTVSGGENLKLTAALGAWRIDATAYQGDVLAGTGSLDFDVSPGINSIRVPMTINGGYFAISVSAEHGTITPSPANAFPGTVITLTVTPSTGYQLKSGFPRVTKTGDAAAAPETVGGSGPYTFTMPGYDVRVSAEFESSPAEPTPPPDTYSIAIGTLSNGTISADLSEAGEGDTVTLTVTPSTGYQLKSGFPRVTKTGDTAAAPETVGGSGPYTFTMPGYDVTVSAEFNPSFGFTIEGPGDLEINITVKRNGTAPVTGLAQISWADGESLTFKVETPGYTMEAGNLVWTEANLWQNLFLFNGSGNSLIINAGDLAVRAYNLTVMIKEAGQWYSTSIPFEVVD
jgi:hypothetical protein